MGKKYVFPSWTPLIGQIRSDSLNSTEQNTDRLSEQKTTSEGGGGTPPSELEGVEEKVFGDESES